MAQNDDPKWEVVDELPGERKPSKRASSTNMLKNQALWFGVGIGVLLALIVPVFRIGLFYLFRSWWIWVPIVAYLIWRRIARARR